MPPEEKPDAVEIWAKRVGRTLGYAVVGILAVYLIYTYGIR